MMKYLFSVVIAMFLAPFVAMADGNLPHTVAQPAGISIRGDALQNVQDMPDTLIVKTTRRQTPIPGFHLDLRQSQRAQDGYDLLEFSDGLNTLTIAAYQSWSHMIDHVTPYVGPAQATPPDHAADTFVTGAMLPIGDHWAIFGEYQATVSPRIATTDLDKAPRIDTVNIGVSFNF